MLPSGGGGIVCWVPCLGDRAQSLATVWTELILPETTLRSARRRCSRPESSLSLWLRGERMTARKAVVTWHSQTHSNRYKRLSLWATTLHAGPQLRTSTRRASYTALSWPLHNAFFHRCNCLLHRCHPDRLNSVQTRVASLGTRFLYA